MRKTTIIAIAAAAVLLPASAWAGGHLEFWPLGCNKRRQRGSILRLR